MTRENEERLTMAQRDLIDEMKRYNTASTAGAGFYERRDIRKNIREIEQEIQQLRNLPKPHILPAYKACFTTSSCFRVFGSRMPGKIF